MYVAISLTIWIYLVYPVTLLFIFICAKCHEEEEEYVRDDSPLANSDDKSTEEDAHVDEEGIYYY